MNEKELNEILQEKVPTDITFLSELNKTDTLQEQKTDIIDKVNDTEEKTYVCKHCGQEGFKSRIELMQHAKKCPNKPIKEEKVNTKQKEEEEEMDNDNLPEIFEKEPTDIVDTETTKQSPKSKSTKEVKEPVTPTIFDRLSKLLKGYNVSREKGIVQSAEMYDVGSPTFIPVLKNLLVNAGVNPPVISLIVESWGQIVGIKTEAEISASNLSSINKQTTPTDALSLMAKLRDDDIQDSIVDSYKEKIKSKKLENEISIKRLNGEYMDNNNRNTPDISKIIELEMLKYQMMQPKTNPEIEMLKLELERLKMQNSQPKTDVQVESLKAELLEMRRKQDEDAKMNQIREEARRDRELFEKRIEDLAKQNQTMIQAMQTANAPKTEDVMRTQIVEMQRQFNEQLAKLTNDFVNNRKEDAFKSEFERLKEENKQIRETSESQIGNLASNMKDFASNMTNAFEKTLLQKEHEKREDELKKKISDIEHNKSLTNEQYMMEKTTKIAEEAVKAIGGAVDGFGRALQPATKSAADSSAIMERAALAMDLKAKGFPDQTINNVLTQHGRPAIPSARTEYENLSKITNQISDERNATQQQVVQEQPQVFEQPPEQTVVKFATSADER